MDPVYTFETVEEAQDYIAKLSNGQLSSDTLLESYPHAASAQGKENLYRAILLSLKAKYATYPVATAIKELSAQFQRDLEFFKTLVNEPNHSSVVNGLIQEVKAELSAFTPAELLPHSELLTALLG